MLDARPFLNAQANRATGGGVETIAKYDFLDIAFLNITNIHSVRESFLGMMACTSVPEAAFRSTVEKTQWIELLGALIEGTGVIVGSLVKGQSVLVHCSDGWDRTAQLCSLTQLLLDPYYRSLPGFSVLIEKDWVTIGHQFDRRYGHASSDLSDTQRSPVFLQFLDTVYQLTEQFPSQFEFSEKLLLDLAEWAWAGRFGTFMCNSHAERVRNGVYRETSSVWTYVLTHSKEYTNPFYSPSPDSILRPSSSPRKLKVWSGLFFKYHRDFYYPETGFTSPSHHLEVLMRQTKAGKDHLNAEIDRIEQVADTLRTQR